MVDMIFRHVAPLRHRLEDSATWWLRARTGDADADRDIARLERKQLRSVAMGVVAWMVGMVVAATLDEAWPVVVGAALVIVGAVIAYVWRETQKNVIFAKTTLRRGRRRP
ncbi:MAG: hypothetical protein IH616_16020 [Gemmatimonadales bacterium]|nr:hypothetical protein [Gemmatimonadales bacterium]